MMTEITRREIVAGSAALALTTASSSALAQQGTKAAQPRQNVINLECAFKDVVIDGNKMRLRAFNGQIPGPLMKIFPGQTLHINLKNSLPPYDSTGWDGEHNVPHHLGSTNLHLHGLDIIPHLFEPVGTSDPMAPMIEIMPGESKEYVFQIPRDHPPGLNWYHPHHHGSTAVQAVTGMAGGIVVYGAIDEVPEIKAAKEYFVVMQDLGLFPSEDDASIWTYLPKQNAIWQTFGTQNPNENVTIYDPKTGKNVPTPLQGGFTTGDYRLRYYLTNGEPFFKEVHNPQDPTSPTPTQLKPPRFTLAPGEVVRFRMLNACSDNYMPIAVEGHDMYLLALDGVNFPKVRTLAQTPIPGPNDPNPNEGQIQLAPANRAEFLIKGSAKPGIYRIVQIQQKQQFLFSAQKVIAEIEITGTPVNMALPVALPVPTREYPLIKPNEVQNLRVIFFADQFPGSQNPYVGIDFTLNGQQYDVTQVNYVVDLGAVEEWRLVVGDSQHGGTEGHPFHIHVNSFEVISVNGQMLEPGTIKDTIWIPAESTVVIRMRFKEFIGKSVFHCHILPHEDTGMMQNFLIKKRGQPFPPSIFEPPMHPRLRPLLNIMPAHHM